MKNIQKKLLAVSITIVVSSNVFAQGGWTKGGSHNI